MFQFNAQLGVRDLNGNLVSTPVLGYGGVGPSAYPGVPASYPGLTIEATMGRATVVKWINNLPATGLFTVDHTVHGTFDPGTGPGKQFPLRQYSDTRVVVHLHGAFVAHPFDGWPMYWFTSDPASAPNAITMQDGTLMPMGGPAGNYAIYHYPNAQSAATLWYHDHAQGITRMNVYGGLAGFYLLRDDRETTLVNSGVLPTKQYEIPIVIQDRTFNIYKTDNTGAIVFDQNGNPIVDPTISGYGSLHYNEVPPPGDNGEAEWMPEMFGDTAVVNGRVRPYLNVDRRTYRFRILNGCQARVLTLYMVDPFGVQTPPTIVQVGSDSGLLPNPVPFHQPDSAITLMGAERADVLIDFSRCAPGSSFVLKNSAPAPYPDGGAADAYQNPIPLVYDIMQFRVQRSLPVQMSSLPATLVAAPALGTPVITRDISLNDFGGTQASSGVNGLLINNVHFDVDPTIKPVAGTTERWRFLNLAPDGHPMHVHLVKFAVIGRMPFIGPGINEMIDTTQAISAHPLDSSKPYAPWRWGGVKQYLFDNGLAMYDPVAGDIAVDIDGTQLLLNAGIGYRSGKNGMSGKYWDPTGTDRTAPAVPQTAPPVDVKVGAKYLYLTGQTLPPGVNERGWKDTVRAEKNMVTIIQAVFDAPPGVSYTDPVTNELTGARYPIHCHILDHEDNDMMTSFALQPPGTTIQTARK